MSAIPARLLRTVSLLVATGVVFANAQAPTPAVEHEPVGLLTGNALERLGVTVADRRAAQPNPSIRYNGITRFVDRARTVVTGSLDDSTLAMTKAIDAMDVYGIKATIAISTQSGPIAQLWPRLRTASRTAWIGSIQRHQCQWPDAAAFCRSAYAATKWKARATHPRPDRPE